MVAYKFQYKDRLSSEMIHVIPATPKYTTEIKYLAAAAYRVSPEQADESFGEDQYKSRIKHFPEGQFIALDGATGRVVGLTSSMRFQYNAEGTFLEDWDRTTCYG
jgi:hypothetical protein